MPCRVVNRIPIPLLLCIQKRYTNSLDSVAQYGIAKQCQTSNRDYTCFSVQCQSAEVYMWRRPCVREKEEGREGSEQFFHGPCKHVFSPQFLQELTTCCHSAYFSQGSLCFSFLRLSHSRVLNDDRAPEQRVTKFKFVTRKRMRPFILWIVQARNMVHSTFHLDHYRVSHWNRYHRSECHTRTPKMCCVSKSFFYGNVVLGNFPLSPWKLFSATTTQLVMVPSIVPQWNRYSSRDENDCVQLCGSSC